MFNIKRLSKKIAILCTLPLAVSLTGCETIKEKIVSNGDTEAATTTATMPVYNVAINTNYPPFEFRGETGITGFDVDLLNAVAEKSGFKVDYHSYATADRAVQAVQEGDEHMSASAIVIVDSRRDLVEYSDSYLTLPLAIVGLDTANKPKSLEDIVNKTIVIDDHLALDDNLQRFFKERGNKVIKTDGHFRAFEQMYNGKVDLMLENVMSIQSFSDLEDDKELFYIPLPKSQDEKLGYVAQKGNVELISKLNDGLKQIKEDGTYDKIYKKWFAKDDG